MSKPKKCVLRRRIPEFGLEMAWYGDNRVVVEDRGCVIYAIRLKTAALQTAAEVMDSEREAMHNSCQLLA